MNGNNPFQKIHSSAWEEFAKSAYSQISLLHEWLSVNKGLNASL